MNRAYSILEVKSVDDEQRVITGIATTPSPDRLGDIVQTSGIKFKNPMPLLWQHRSDKPVGQVKFDKPTEDGITFTARMPTLDQPGPLKDRIDEAWQSIKLGLVRAVSIGFRPIKYAFMDNGGVDFQESEVLELSLVTIPANADAKIQTFKNNPISVIKSIDAPFLKAAGIISDHPIKQRKDMGEMEMPYPASDENQNDFMSRCVDHMLNCSEMTKAEANGHCAINWDNRNAQMKNVAAVAASGNTVGAIKNPPASGKISNKVVSARKEGKMTKKTIVEQIASFEASRQAKNAEMDAIMDVAAEKNETLDAEQQEKYDNLESEVKAIDNHLVRLRAHEERNKAAAIDIKDVSSQQQAADVRGNTQSVARVVMGKKNLIPGLAFTRYVKASAIAKGQRLEALDIVRRNEQWMAETPEVELALRTAVSEMNTTTGLNALVNYQVLVGEFIEFLRPLTIIGRIPGLRRVPFNVKIGRQTGGATVNWVGQGAPKPLTADTFDNITLDLAKIAGIIVLTDELVRLATPAADALVRDDLAAAIVQFMDNAFVDPTKAAVTGVSPASIINGITPITATGTTGAALRADLKTLINTFLATNLQITSAVFLMTQQTAMAISLMTNSLGVLEFPNISMTGGTLLGIPVVTSENIPATGGSPSDGYPIILLNASDILLADDGSVTIDASREASLQMDTAPDSPATASTTFVSMFQQNMTAIRAERFINWAKRRSQAAQFIQNAKYFE